MKKEITVAVAGNPNAGKTTLFNTLTGARQQVGNWPGVTVEKIEGSYQYGDYRVRLVDLPGVYSLTAYSIDEVIARSFILENKPDVVVDIIDATNLERNLYLTTQLIEMEVKLVVVLNMMDMAGSRGYKIDIDRLSYLLSVPVVPMVATRKEGINTLRQVIIDVFEGKVNLKKINLNYGHELEGHITDLEGLIAQDEELSHRFPPRWLAIKLLEGDEEVLEKTEIKVE
ncbi:FeoB small GTPase domain-containing protein [Chloroflexota bacterium]